MLSASAGGDDSEPCCPLDVTPRSKSTSTCQGLGLERCGSCLQLADSGTVVIMELSRRMTDDFDAMLHVQNSLIRMCFLFDSRGSLLQEEVMGELNEPDQERTKARRPSEQLGPFPS